MTRKTKAAAAAANDQVMAFSFGDAERVLDRREILDHLECWSNGRWYEPPINMNGLARVLRVGSHHESPVRLKVNLLTELFVPGRLMSTPVFSALALDFLVFGNTYPEMRRAVTGRSHHFERPLARYMRRGIEPGVYFQVHQHFDPTGRPEYEHRFEKGAIFHLAEPDVNQDIYGLPEYVSALPAAFLNESATIFRRRYYENGSHAGFILLATDAQMDEPAKDSIRKALKDAKGVGNFKNLFVHLPNGKSDSLKLIPIAEIAAKDEFLGIKNTSRDDVLAAHRTPPQLVGLVPANAGGFGDIAKASDAFVRLEIAPLQRKLLALNDQVGEEVIRFKPWEPMASTPAAPGVAAA
ncbi:phage portal protein [Phenylobacterium sp.]|uniref:phage portal protein n=1 Tax=Phenylobacterium sp. TaxID=1871053 RepID=UPI00301BF8DA